MRTGYNKRSMSLYVCACAHCSRKKRHIFRVDDDDDHNHHKELMLSSNKNAIILIDSNKKKERER